MPDSERYPAFESILKEREEEGQLRSLTHFERKPSGRTVTIAGKEYLNFCSNDYLGLSTNREVIERSVQFVNEYGTGTSASRLISGSYTIHQHLEERLATLCKREAALLFASGFQANMTVIPALTGKGDLILADREVHNSIIQGGLLSKAEFLRFRHNDTGHLAALLKRATEKNYRNIWVITESVFSMDGDYAPLKEMAELCKTTSAFFYVDDAHAFGLYGEKGSGLSAALGDVDVIIATLAKAAGGFGGFIATSAVLKNWLVNYCSGFIYSTALPPALIGAAEAAIDLISGMDEERLRLKKLGRDTIESLHAIGYHTGESSSQIIPILMKDEQTALELRDHLLDQEIFIQAVRPPTVKQSRLRVTVTALHTEADIKRLTEVLENHG